MHTRAGSEARIETPKFGPLNGQKTRDSAFTGAGLRTHLRLASTFIPSLQPVYGEALRLDPRATKGWKGG